MGSITNANPAVVTLANSFSENDNVLITGTTGMTQIAGMLFTITNVTAAGFDLTTLDASSFANPATAVTATLAEEKATLPSIRYITQIIRGLPTTVVFSTAHDYIASQVLTFSIPRPFGMYELDQKNLVVSGVVDSYSVTINLDTTFYSAFAFPPSSPTTFPNKLLFATVAPGGSRNGYNVSTIPFRENT